MSGDDLDSMASTYSQVSWNGEEMPADEAVDSSMKDIQGGINEIHIAVRNMLTSDERGEGYEVQKEQYDNILETLKESTALMKDIAKICKQLVPPKPRGQKKLDKTADMLASMTIQPVSNPGDPTPQ